MWRAAIPIVGLALAPVGGLVMPAAANSSAASGLVTVSATVSPSSGGTVQAGATVTYTLHATSQQPLPQGATVVDDLAGWAGSATVTTSNADLAQRGLALNASADQLTWRVPALGTPGTSSTQAVTSFQATVAADAPPGKTLTTSAFPQGGTCSAGGSCATTLTVTGSPTPAPTTPSPTPSVTTSSTAPPTTVPSATPSPTTTPTAATTAPAPTTTAPTTPTLGSANGPAAAAGPAQAGDCTDPQSATSTVLGGFEIDGNLCVNTPGNLDWGTVGGQPVVTDGLNDTTVFTGGAAETGPNGWPWSVSQTQGLNPSRGTDINQVFAFTQTVNNQVFLYTGWTRDSSTGSAGFFLELNQQPNRFGPVPNRTTGDLRLGFTQSGNTLLALTNAALWASTGPNSGTWNPIPTTGFAAATNPSAVSNLQGLSPSSLVAGTFAEVGINLSELFAAAGDCSGAFLAVNLRSAPAVTGNPTLQDWVAPIVGLDIPTTCVSVVVDKDWVINGVHSIDRAPPGFVARLNLTDPTGTRTGLIFGLPYDHRADGTRFEQNDPITIGEDVTVPPGCINSASGDIGNQVLQNIGVNHFTVTNTVTCPALISIDKTADPTTFNAPDTPITYTYVVTNRGDVTLFNVQVTDPHPGLSAITCNPAQGSSLAPGATMTCTATYLTTQADVDAGEVTNTGTVIGTPPSGPAVTDDSPATVTAEQTPAINLDKSASPTQVGAVGEVITYTYRVTNIGNVTLHDIALSDDRLGAITCPETVLAPGAQMDCTATYTVTQADLDAGKIVNVATVTGLPPTEPPVIGTDTDTVTAVPPTTPPPTTPPPTTTPPTTTPPTFPTPPPGEGELVPGDLTPPTPEAGAFVPGVGLTGDRPPPGGPGLAMILGTAGGALLFLAGVSGAAVRRIRRTGTPRRQ
jgi:uncharacterized repeat protein (TIGR01451 family)